MTRRIIAAAMMVAQAGMALAQAAAPTPPAQRSKIDQVCIMNPALAICTARLEGVAKTQGVDLVAAVKRGEGWRTTAVTISERVDCWAIWSALGEHVGRNGLSGLPADYTQANLAKRASDWQAVLTPMFTPDSGRDMSRETTAALVTRRADVASARLVKVAEFSGMCKKLPSA